MALSPVFGVARVVFRGAASVQPIVNVMHVANNWPGLSSFTQAQIDQLVVSMASLFTGNLVPLTASVYSGLDCTALDLSSDVGVSATAPMPGGGTGTGTQMANSIATCLSWRTPRHYRGGHPRTYMGPPASVTVTNGTSFTTAHVNASTAAGTAFLNGVNGLSLAGQPARLVAVHRIRNGIQLPDPLVDAITGVTVDTRIDTQRRRLGRDR